MVKRELQTLSGTVCYTCSFPTTSTGANASAAKSHDLRGDNSLPGGVSWVSSAFTFGLCIFVGLVLGWFLRTIWAPIPPPAAPDPVPAAPRPRGRRQVASNLPRTWSDRLAERLQDILEVLVEHWQRHSAALRPTIRRTERVMGRFAVTFRRAVESCYQVVEPLEMCNKQEATPESTPKATPKVPQVSKKAQSSGNLKATCSSDGACAVKSLNAPDPEKASQVQLEASDADQVTRSPWTEVLRQLTEGQEGARQEKLPWDPLRVSSGPDTGGNNPPPLTIPEEWMKKLIENGNARAKAAARPNTVSSSADTGLLPLQRRALRRLQQRREAAAAASQVPKEPVAEVPEEPLDETWIDEFEESTKKEKEAKEARLQQKRERQQRLRARRLKGANRTASNPGSGPGSGKDAEPELDSRKTEAGEDDVDEDEDVGDEDTVASAAAEEPSQATRKRAGPGTPSRAGNLLQPSGMKAEESNAALGEARQQDNTDEDGDNDDDCADDAADEPCSHDVEHLLELVGSGESVAGDGVLQSDLLFSEAMHGLFLLASGSKDKTEAANSSEAAGTSSSTPAAPAAAAAAACTTEVARHAAKPAKAKSSQQRQQEQQQGKQHSQQQQQQQHSQQSKSLPATVQHTQAQGNADAGAGSSITARAKEKPTAPDKTGAAAAATHQRTVPADRKQRPPPAATGKPPPAERVHKLAPWADVRAMPPAAQPDAVAEPATGMQASSLPSASTAGAAPTAWVKHELLPSPDTSLDKEAPSEPAVGTVPPTQIGQLQPGTQPQVPEAASQLEGKGSKMAADAPDFVPFSQMQPTEAAAAQVASMQQASAAFACGTDPSNLQPESTMTTIMISGIHSGHTPESFRQQLDAWGLMGTYDFYFMPTADGTPAGCAVVNFIDPTFASLCQMIFQQYQSEGSAQPYHVQGLDNNIAHWSQYLNQEDIANAPLIIPTPVPSQWAVNGANVMLNSKFSPQIRGQFRKTKLCVFHKKNKCMLATSCPFAHTKEELQPAPDLAKTKLCFNFFRRRCNDSRCKYAHGYQELRATNNVYKTELCRWWSYGSCKAGDSCRYAHGVEELRAGEEGMMSFMEGGHMPLEPNELPPHFMMQPPAASGDRQDMPMLPVPGVALGPFYFGTGLDTSMATERSSEPADHPVEEVKEAESDGASDMGFSDVSTSWGVMDTKLRRQQTAPPASSLSELHPAEGQGSNSGDNPDTTVVRVKRTFLEAMQMDEEPRPLAVPLHRSWSDGDLAQLCEVMACMEDYDDSL